MPATIFSGNNVKALKAALQLGDNSVITSGAVDPSSVATTGAAGDVYISTSTKLIYIKQDAGSSTNWNKAINSDGAFLNYNSGTHTLTVANLTVNGTTTNINTTNVNVSDKLVILNKGGVAASGNNVGFEVEENGIITGYTQTSADRSSWELKAPNTAGVATLTPGTGGLTLEGSGSGVLIPVNLNVTNDIPGNIALTVQGSPGGVAPTDLLFDAEYTNGTNLNATYVSTGSATPLATVGSPTVTSSKLDLTANTGQYVQYDGSAAKLATQTGCIRFRYTPNYTGIPASDMLIVSISDSGGSLMVNNSINIFHLAGSGSFGYYWFDSVGTNYYTHFAYSPTSGIMDEFEFNWNINAGVLNLFRNGIVVASSGEVTTRTTTGLTSLYVGTVPGEAGSNFLLTDLVVYNAVQHTSNFSSPIPALDLGGGAGQTANLQNWNNGAGSVLTSVNNEGFLTLVGDPTANLMAATKQYVDNKVLVFTSAASAGGASSEALTVTGLLSTDTVLSVTQQTPGANSTAINGYSTLIDDGLTVQWTGDPGAGAIVVVGVIR